MARYLILGAGKFGRLALERLSQDDAAATFQIVDRTPQALQAIRGLSPARVELVEAEAAAFLTAGLQDSSPWDWLIPAVPEHVVFSWLRQGPLAGPDWQTVPVPPELTKLTPVAWRGQEGEERDQRRSLPQNSEAIGHMNSSFNE